MSPLPRPPKTYDGGDYVISAARQRFLQAQFQGLVAEDSVKTRHFPTDGTKPILAAGFFVLVFAYLFLLGRIGMPLAHDFFDPLVMRDTGLLVPALIERGAPLSTFLVEAMKHLEGPIQFLIMASYALGIGDAFPLTPATMQFPNTLLVLFAAAFAFLLIRRLFDLRMAYCTVLAFVLTPWIGHVTRVTWYFNSLALALQFSAVYLLVGFMSQPENRIWRVLFPFSLAAYLLSSLEWPSFFLFVGLFCIFNGHVRRIFLNPYNVVIVAALAVLLAWDTLVVLRFGTAGLAHTRLLYAFAVSSAEGSYSTLTTIWQNEFLGWGPLMAAAFGGLAFYLVALRKRVSTDTMTRGFLDASGLWLLWATIIVFWAGGHRTYLYVLGMPAAVFSALALSRVPVKPLVAVVVALSIFQIGIVTDWGFGTKTDERRRVLAAACFLIEDRPDLLASDKTLLAIDCRRRGEQGLGGAVAQYARPRKPPIIMPDYFPVTGWIGRGFGPDGPERLADIIQTYAKTGVLKADGLILESEALAAANPASKFWARVASDPNIEWIARFKENAGEIFIGVPVMGKGIPLEKAKSMDVRALSDRYLVKYDRFSFLVKNLEHARLYFTSGLSK